MNLEGRSLVAMDDLSNEEIEALFQVADEMAGSMGEQACLCKGKIMASLFFEPSTRTRLSFEAAMLRMGGQVITAVDIGATSLAKGESIADMARVVGSYADIIVIRHPWEGAARVVADYAGVPVINAGDGGHEHPTQTLLDLYTIRKERGTIKGLKIALWGDLKYGRTVHSLACALARFGASILFRPGPGLEMPEHVVRKLTKEYGGELRRCEVADQPTREDLFSLDAIYVTPSTPHQLAMMPDISIQVELEKGVDAIYVTRFQKERHAEGEGARGPDNGYPVVDKRLLREKSFKETLVMHPLPRIDELAHELDADPRSMYFKQAARGVPIRMALMSLLLGAKLIDVCGTKDAGARRKADYPVYDRGFGVTCQNRNCVSVHEKRYIKPEFRIVSRRRVARRHAGEQEVSRG
jgi:aspartate carbamoyltransferase catalytic subunit